MSFEMRPARHEDVAGIAPWTVDTFEWGDYVSERLPSWIDDPDSHPLVCVDESGRPVAVANTAMLSPTEAWLEGARVHPGFKRSGMGSAMNRAGTEWARGRGARVARLATEITNVASQRQVEAIGYRHTSSWAHATLAPGERSAVGPGRGLSQASLTDVDACWLSWSNSELARAGREMRAIGWRWRKARPEDLVGAASRGELLQSPTGWALVEHPGPDWLRIGWVISDPDGLPGLIEGLADLGSSMEVAEIGLTVPWLPWVVETLARAGGTPMEILVYTLGL